MIGRTKTPIFYVYYIILNLFILNKIVLYFCSIMWLFFIKACGFEILVSQAKSTVTDTPVDLTYDKRWHHYKSSLADKGYFKVIIHFNLLDFLIYTRNISIFTFLIINYLVVP